MTKLPLNLETVWRLHGKIISLNSLENLNYQLEFYVYSHVGLLINLKIVFDCLEIKGKTFSKLG